MKKIIFVSCLLAITVSSVYAGEKPVRKVAAIPQIPACQAQAIGEMTKYIHTQESDFKKSYVLGQFADMSSDGKTITQEWQYGPAKTGNYVCATIQCTYTGDYNGSCSIGTCTDNGGC